MPNENVQVPNPGQQSAADPIPNVTQTSSPPPQVTAPESSGKNIMLPQAAFKERVQAAKQSGRRELTSELDREAQALGYANHAAMMEILRARKGQQAAPRPSGNQQARQPAPVTIQSSQPEPSAPPTPPKNGQDRKAWQKYEQDRRIWDRDRQQLQKQLTEESNRRKKAERKAAASEARANLERIASGCGVKRIGQAIYLFEQAQQGKTVEELEKVDEAKFFEGLRQTDSYLFGEAVIPATTGTTSAPPGSRTPPRPAETSTAAGSANDVDVMNMTEQEFALRQRQRGIRTVPMGLG